MKTTTKDHLIDKKEFSEHLFLTYVNHNNERLQVENKDVTQFLEPLKQHNILVLKGERGSGKTTLLKYIFTKSYFEYKNRFKNFMHKPGDLYIPVFIDKQCLTNTKHPLDHYFQEVKYQLLRLTTLLSKDFSEFYKEEKSFFQQLKLNHNHSQIQRKVLLCIDGFNELSHEMQESLKAELNELSACENVKIIVATRYMPLDVETISYDVEKISEAKVKEYLNEEKINYDAEEVAFITSPLLAKKFLEWKKSQVDAKLAAVDKKESFRFAQSITSSVDIYWNAFLTDVKKMAINNGSTDSVLYTLTRYFLPFLTYQIENDENIDVLKDAFSAEWFAKQFNKFVENMEGIIPKNDKEVKWDNVEKANNEKEIYEYIQYLEESAVYIKLVENNRKKQKKYSFVNEEDQIFLTAVHQYDQDLCSLFDLNYKNDPNKTTMGKSFRIFYSGLMCSFMRDVDCRNIEILNQAKWKEICSDLYYYGEGMPKDEERALEISKKAVSSNIIGDAVSKNWHKWNIFYIELDRIKRNLDDGNVEQFKEMFRLLENDEWKGYYPLYDKLGSIFYEEKLCLKFKMALTDANLREQVVNVFPRIEFWNTEVKDKETWNNYLDDISGNREEIARLFFETAAYRGNYHYAHNKLGAIYEKTGEIEKAYREFELSYKCTHTDYYAISKMLHLVDGIAMDAESKKNLLDCAEKAHSHVLAVSPITGCNGIQGYSNLLTALGDWYYKQYLNSKEKEKAKKDLKDAFDRYMQNVLINEEKKSFCDDKCALIASFLGKKYPKDCIVSSYCDEIDMTLDAFQRKYPDVNDAVTKEVLAEYQTLVAGEEMV